MVKASRFNMDTEQASAYVSYFKIKVLRVDPSVLAISVLFLTLVPVPPISMIPSSTSQLEWADLEFFSLWVSIQPEGVILTQVATEPPPQIVFLFIVWRILLMRNFGIVQGTFPLGDMTSTVLPLSLPPQPPEIINAGKSGNSEIGFSVSICGFSAPDEMLWPRMQHRAGG